MSAHLHGRTDGGAPARQAREGMARPASKEPFGRFVSNVTIPDGSVMTRGSKFVKIWKVRNSGSENWPAGCRLDFVGGDKLAPEGVQIMPLPVVAAGAEIDVAIDMTAPSEPGRYVSFWRLATPAGVRFGHRLWTDITVVSSDSAASIAEVVGGGAEDAGAAYPSGDEGSDPEPEPASSHPGEIFSHIFGSFFSDPEVRPPPSAVPTAVAQPKTPSVAAAVPAPAPAPVPTPVPETNDAPASAAPAAAPVVAAAEPEIVPTKYEEQLRDLEAMGFNRSVAAALLEVHQGDLLAVVSQMLQK